MKEGLSQAETFKLQCHEDPAGKVTGEARVERASGSGNSLLACGAVKSSVVTEQRARREPGGEGLVRDVDQ